MDIHELFSHYGIPAAVSDSTNNTEAVVSTDNEQRRTFAQVLGNQSTAIPMKVSEPPKYVGGNIQIEIDEEEYRLGLMEHEHSLIGRLVLLKGDKPLKTVELKEKLSKIWGLDVNSWQLVALGKGYYNMHMKTMDAKSRVFSRGAIFLKPGVFRISQWVPDFNPSKQKQTNSQVWIRIFDLPQEYWRPAILCSIARGVGLPLRIDNKTLSKEVGLFARVLVDIDFVTSTLPDELLLTRRNKEFYVYIGYEKLPGFCTKCGVVGHDFAECKRNENAHKPPQKQDDTKLSDAETEYSDAEEDVTREEKLEKMAEDIMHKAASELIEEAFNKVFVKEECNETVREENTDVVKTWATQVEEEQQEAVTPATVRSGEVSKQSKVYSVSPVIFNGADSNQKKSQQLDADGFQTVLSKKDSRKLKQQQALEEVRKDPPSTRTRVLKSNLSQ